MKPCKRILLAEDDPKDVELTISALSKHNLANDIKVVCDGAEVLDYLYHRERFAHEPGGNPAVILTSSRETQDLETCYQLSVNAYVVKPVRFADFVEAVKQIGGFGALIIEPPLSSLKIQ